MVRLDTAIEVLLWHSGVVPVQTSGTRRAVSVDRSSQRVFESRSSGFDHSNRDRLVLRQAIGKHSPCCASSNDHVIEDWIIHRYCAAQAYQQRDRPNMGFARGVQHSGAQNKEEKQSERKLWN
jgi:hypothetical protein